MEEEHIWTYDEWSDEDGSYKSSELYCCKCFQFRDYDKSEEQENPCPGYHK